MGATAKATPSAAVFLAATSPKTWPSALRSGPPELPGLMAPGEGCVVVAVVVVAAVVGPATTVPEVGAVGG